jgi:hypothetical protein
MLPHRTGFLILIIASRHPYAALGDEEKSESSRFECMPKFGVFESGNEQLGALCERDRSGSLGQPGCDGEPRVEARLRIELDLTIARFDVEQSR